MQRTNGIMLWLAGAFLAFSPRLWADEHRWTHFGLRPLGMGNAYVAVADDFNALFYNPAGLARIKEWDVELLNPSFEVAQHTYETVGDVLGLGKNKSGDIKDMLDFFSEQSGKTHHLAYSQTPHFIMKNFGLGIGLEFAANLVPHSTINMEVDVGPRVIAPLAFAASFLENRLSLGMAVKFLARGGVNRSFTLDTLSALTAKDEDQDADSKPKLEEYLEGGYGMGVDFGLLFTPMDTMQPTLGLSIADVGGTGYKKVDIQGKAVTTPRARLPALNTGISIKPIQSELHYLLLAMDAHIINQPVHFSHKLNMGAEWGFSEIFKLQVGLKEGYWTGGMQLDVGLLNLRLATYMVDHGPVVGLAEDLAERRYTLQLKLLI